VVVGGAARDPERAARLPEMFTGKLYQ